MSKHTPGPWQCIEYPKVFSINAQSKRQIAIMTEHHGDEPMTPMSQFKRSKQDEKDARLIAAAPDLLLACKAALEAFELNAAIDWNDLENAIKKAEGT